MRWDEMTKIEVALNGDLTFHGRNKRLALCGTATWKKVDKEQMLTFIQSQAQAWAVDQQPTQHAELLSKNTKVARDTRRPPLSS
jgi:hypothetical protein